jgi:hypothetical protein
LPRISAWVAFSVACVLLACGGSGAGEANTEHTPCTSCAQAGAENGGAPDNDAGAGGAAPSVADGIAVSEVSFWQAVRVPLELDGAAAPANAPLIQNKDGILRVYVKPAADFRARNLSVDLDFASGGVPLALSSQKLIRTASEHGEFASTFNFPIDGQHVLADASYSVTLRDGPGGSVLARYPASADSALEAQTAGDALHVVVVPMVVGGVMPDVSPGTLARFRARVLSMYPLANFQISARAAISSAIALGPDQGWDDALDALYAQRASDAPAANVFYYGMFTPTQRFADYCVSDCTVGYSVVTDPDDVDERGSVGLGIFADGSNSDAPDTMAHELGHALGRDHAPCDVSRADSGPFPYPGGKIGVWGFDSLDHLLLDPKVYGDVMGYCSPDWISDYTYRALFRRIQAVNAEVSDPNAKALRPQLGAYRRVLVRPSGALGWGSRFRPSRTPHGTTRGLTLLGTHGRVVRHLDLIFRPFSAGSGGFLLLPESALSGVSALRVGTAQLAVATP